MKQLLKQYFGYNDFRPGQEKLIEEILSGRDVLGIMPTGAGKSICYQIPALKFEGITLVISPLISLMKDQVSALNEVGIHAAYINSSLSEDQVRTVFQRAKEGAYKIIYIAPERLDTERFNEFIEKTDISLVAVDEAHCVSQWGQDFRPGYLNIAVFMKKMSGWKRRPVLCAFTATATKEVRDDVVRMLGLRRPEILVTGFNRENLYFSVNQVEDKKQEALKYVREHDGQSGIIYCNTRKNVEEVFEFLSENNLSVAKYHAGMSTRDREKSQEDFIYDRKQVIVATNAFGMGIDKSDVRYVLHYNMPQSMENYYQEAGRAGRDGAEAECMLFYAPKDVAVNRFLIENKETKREMDEWERREILEHDRKKLRAMTFYGTTKECLRQYILNYFGETTYVECGKCANCNADFERHDVTGLAKNIVNCVYELRQCFGINTIIDIVRGSKKKHIVSKRFDKLRSYGRLSAYSEATLRQVIDALLQEGLLIQTADKYPVVRLGSDYMKLNEMDFGVYIKSEVRKNRGRELKKSLLDDKGGELFEKLRELRLKFARKEGVPPFCVFTDKTLVDMCRKRPHTGEEMLEVSGVGENKLKKYGEKFLEVIALEGEDGTI